MLKISESKMSLHRPGLSAGIKVCKKYRKQTLRKKMWKKECKNLKAIVPKVANKKVSEVTVIEEAIDYIEHLHSAIAKRLGVLPDAQSLPLPPFNAPTAHLKETQSQTTHCQLKSQPQMPIRLPFVDAAFLQLLQSRGTQETWGSSPQPCLYQKQVS